MKYLTLVGLCLLIGACDPEKCTTHYLNNATDKDLRIEFFPTITGSSLSNISLPSGEQSKIAAGCALGSRTQINFASYDSIVVYEGQIPIINYTEGSSGDNIYRYENWTLKEENKNDYSYTFTITEADLADAQD